mgnify:FL=1
MILLFISGIQIIIIFLFLFILIISALVLASKNENNKRFLIWGLIIFLFPFLGAIAYILKHLISKNKVIHEKR